MITSISLSVDIGVMLCWMLFPRDAISQKGANEDVNIVGSREPNKLEQVEYLRSSVVQELSKA